jgi:N,N'-diacetyllegionaminate synthase
MENKMENKTGNKEQVRVIDYSKNKINFNKHPFVIAEAGVNHNGDLKIAYDMIDVAKEAGADCIKFQSYTASELSVRSAPKADYQKQSGKKGETQYDMLLRYELKENDFIKLKEYCDKKEIMFLSTPFSQRWVKILFNLGAKAFKIGSGNLKMNELLKSIGETGLPVILSTGMHYLNEINDSIGVLRSYGCRDLSILHCVTIYPTPLNKINLFTIRALQEKFNLTTGFSDHTEEVFTGSLAVAAGASILEKHFTLNKNFDGPDHKASLEPLQLFKYIRYAKEAAIICGEKGIEKCMQEEELKTKEVVRTSLVSKIFIKKGSPIAMSMLTQKRPGTGIPPKNIAVVIGSIAKRDIQQDEVLTYDDI